MNKKKLLNGTISMLIFIALVIGANNATGISAIFIIFTMILYTGQIIYFYGNNWTKDVHLKNSKKARSYLSKEDHSGKTSQPELTKNKDLK